MTMFVRDVFRKFVSIHITKLLVVSNGRIVIE